MMGPGPGGRGRMSANAPKLTKEERSHVLSKLGIYLFNETPYLAIALIIMVVANTFSLWGPELSGNAIGAIEEAFHNKITWDEAFETIKYNVILMIVLYVVSAAMSYGLSVLMLFISKRITYKMRKQLFSHLIELPVGFFDTNQVGDIISRMSYDIDTINASLSHDLLQIITSIYTVVFSLVMMIRTSIPLISIFVITVPVSIFFSQYRAKKVRPLFRLRSQKLGEMNGYAEEMLSGHKTIKAYNSEDAVTAKFDELNEKTCEAYYNAEYQGSIVGPSMALINNISVSLVSLFGGLLYMFTLSASIAEGSILFMNLENMSKFINYSKKFSGPINEFANIMNEIHSAMSAAERVFRVLETDKELADIRGAEVLEEVEGSVEIKNVTFGYVEGKTILKNISLSVKPGQTVAIVGPTGSGKTTIINLLMRFYDVNEGEIYVDGKEIRTLTRESLRHAYTMVLQETWLFNASIYDNIAYGREGATEEEVIEAAKAAKIHNYIEALPDGYNTILSDDGINISKGQKQLITIARAMLANSQMLILDEATSNVDSRTEQQIQAAMNKLMHGKTCFVIAHRLSTIQNADIIVVIKDGEIIEQGNHDSLLAKEGGFYASLYNSQFK
jgi:ATP-binding cassette subfamily B protein